MLKSFKDTTLNLTYRLSNQVPRLQLAKPLIPPMECPFIPGAWYTYFPFQPHESKVGYQYSTQGDYGKANQSSSVLQLFNPGVYTIAAGDEWGQMVILHFVVSASIPTATTSRTATSSSNSIPNNVVPCSTTYPNGSSDGTTVSLAQQSGSTANICVRYFYYNSSATTTINTLDRSLSTRQCSRQVPSVMSILLFQSPQAFLNFR